MCAINFYNTLFYIAACSASDSDLARPEHVLIEDVQCGPDNSDNCAETFVQCVRKTEDNLARVRPSSAVLMSSSVRPMTTSSKPQDHQQYPPINRKRLATRESLEIESKLPKTYPGEGCVDEGSEEECSSQRDVFETGCDTNDKQSSSAENVHDEKNENKSNFHDNTCAVSSKSDACRTAASSVTDVCRKSASPKTDLSRTTHTLENSVSRTPVATPETVNNTENCGSGQKDCKQRKRPHYKREKNQLCPLCDVYLKDYDSLYDHLKLRHPNRDEAAEWLSATKAMMRVTCGVCSKDYSSKEQLVVHTNLVHTDHKKVECSLCHVVVKSASHLRGHYRRVHDNNESHKYLCHLCPARFKLQSYLTTHIKFVHTNNEKDAYKCDQCEHTSACLKYLANHKLRVHSTRRFTCRYCQQPFSTVANMQRHERLLHECLKEKPHACETCGKRFTLKANMKHHLLTVHNKRFLYQCTVCKKGFPRQKQLRLHSVEVHSTELYTVTTLSSVCRAVSSDTHLLNTSVAGSGTLRVSTRATGSTVDSIPCPRKTLHTVKYIVATPEIQQTFSVKKDDLV